MLILSYMSVHYIFIFSLFLYRRNKTERSFRSDRSESVDKYDEVRGYFAGKGFHFATCSHCLSVDSPTSGWISQFRFEHTLREPLLWVWCYNISECKNRRTRSFLDACLHSRLLILKKLVARSSSRNYIKSTNTVKCINKENCDLCRLFTLFEHMRVAFNVSPFSDIIETMKRI